MFKNISESALKVIRKSLLLEKEEDEGRLVWSLRLCTMNDDPTLLLGLGQDELKDVEKAPFMVIDGVKIYFLIPDEFWVSFADHIIHFDQELRNLIPLKTLNIEIHS